MLIAGIWLIYYGQKWLLNGYVKQLTDQYPREE